jgi:hypothetical protein
MPIDTNVLEPTRKFPPVPRRNSYVRLGSLTQRFFLKGEEQEANGYENVVLEDDAVRSPEAKFDSFDKIPRKRRGLVLVLLLSSLLVVGALVGRSLRPLSTESAWVKAASRAMVRSAPSVAVPAPAPAAPAATTPATSIAPKSTNEEMAAEPAEPAEPAEATEPPEPARNAVARRRPRPLHGYVWSPAAGAMVPAEYPPNERAPILE